jgi:hypothetical protein
MWARQKALVIGRHQFDLADGWKGHPPTSDHFGSLADGHVMLEDPEVVIQGEGVLHLRYPVRRKR